MYRDQRRLTLRFLLTIGTKSGTKYQLVNFGQKRYINSVESKKQRTLREIGKVSVNFGNLTFASLVLGTIIKGDYDRIVLFFIGGVIAVILVTMGIFLLTIAGGE